MRGLQWNRLRQLDTRRGPQRMDEIAKQDTCFVLGAQRLRGFLPLPAFASIVLVVKLLLNFAKQNSGFFNLWDLVPSAFFSALCAPMRPGRSDNELVLSATQQA